MVSKQEILITSYLRENARFPLTKLSKKLHMPVSTLFGKIKRLRADLITKNTVLLDFNKLGYLLSVDFILKVDKTERKNLEEYLIKNPNVNSLYKLSSRYDFLIETIFKDMNELQGFIEKLEEFKIKEIKEFFVVEDLKREGFLADPSYIELMG